jgi:hypothetical protein
LDNLALQLIVFRLLEELKIFCKQEEIFDVNAHRSCLPQAGYVLFIDVSAAALRDFQGKIRRAAKQAGSQAKRLCFGKFFGGSIDVQGKGMGFVPGIQVTKISHVAPQRNSAMALKIILVQHRATSDSATRFLQYHIYVAVSLPVRP